MHDVTTALKATIPATPPSDDRRHPRTATPMQLAAMEMQRDFLRALVKEAKLTPTFFR